VRARCSCALPAVLLRSIRFGRLQTGELACITEQNKEIKTLLPGELFGELACLRIKKANRCTAAALPFRPRTRSQRSAHERTDGVVFGCGLRRSAR
jgi:hypothetical protein